VADTSTEVSALAIYPVRTYTNAAGEKIQIMGTDRYPEVPGAVRCDITWTDDNPTVFVYKNAAGTVVATKTFTWTDGNPTSTVWT
jgi:hypothetical protein